MRSNKTPNVDPRKNAKRGKQKIPDVNPTTRLFGNNSVTKMHTFEPAGKYARLSDGLENTFENADYSSDEAQNDDTDAMGEDGAALRNSSLTPGRAEGTHLDHSGCNDGGHASTIPESWTATGFVEADLTNVIFGDDTLQDGSPDLNLAQALEEILDINDYTGVSACPAAPTTENPTPTPITRRAALRTKTTPQDAFAMGHLDAHPVYDDDSSDMETNLEQDLEDILDEEANEELDVEAPLNNPGNVHGGLLLQIDDIVWCSICGASASSGNTSLYLRKACEGKPANNSMVRRKGRLVRRKHPTTCARLHGSHKRVRFE